MKGYKDDGVFEEIERRVFSDLLPVQILDTCYVVSETKDNQQSATERAVDLYVRGLTDGVTICGEEARNGYGGAEYVKGLLEAVPVHARYFTRIPKGQPWHTFSEAEAFVKYAQLHRWQRVAVIAPPFHHLRSFLSVVTWAVRRETGLKVYSVPGLSQSWTENVLHSQGLVTGTRAELHKGELDRIAKYSQQEGNILPVSEIFEYLDQRDA